MRPLALENNAFKLILTVVIRFFFSTELMRFVLDWKKVDFMKQDELNDSSSDVVLNMFEINGLISLRKR